MPLSASKKVHEWRDLSGSVHGRGYSCAQWRSYRLVKYPEQILNREMKENPFSTLEVQHMA
jgi:hypothetical protein